VWVVDEEVDLVVVWEADEEVDLAVETEVDEEVETVGAVVEMEVERGRQDL
jgi:hypothetical protein